MTNKKYIDRDSLIDDLIPIFNRLSPQDKGDIMEAIYKQEIKTIPDECKEDEDIYEDLETL